MQIEEQSQTQQTRTTLSDSFLIRHYCLMIYNFYKWYIVPMTRIAPCKYIFKNINLGGWRPVFCVFFSFWKDLVSFACKITQNIYLDSKLLTKWQARWPSRKSPRIFVFTGRKLKPCHCQKSVNYYYSENF